MEQVLGASTDCKKAINEFCMANINHSLCKCWNNQNAAYNSDSCKMFRGIFTDKNSFLDGLNQTDIDYIMSKYGLIKPGDCPKDIKKPDFLKNKYGKYDYEKLKVYLDQGEKIDNVAKIYPDSGKSQEDDEYDWNKLKVNYSSDAKAPASAKKLDTRDMRVGNFYKADPDMNYKANGGEADAKSQYDKVKKLAGIEIEKLNDTKDLNIIPGKRQDKIIPYYKDELDKEATASTAAKTQAETQPAAKAAAAAAPSSKEESFFSRFMKVSLPN
jgi:hypothetical protein